MGSPVANAVRSLVLLSLPYFVMAAGCTPAGSQAVFPDLRQAGATGSTSTSPAATAPASPGIPVLASRLSWQIQYSGELDPETDVDLFNLDLFETPGSFIDELHRDGVFVVCYFSAGSYEDWRPDSPEFPPEVLGEKLAGWPGERWLDITRLDLLAPIMEARLDLAVRKECDGVDPDNVNGYQNATGFALSADNQLAYNIFLSQAAHVRGLAIGLKNDLGQVTDLLPYFEWMLNEECFSYQECSLLLPFVEAGKPVFVIEYDLSPDEFCEQAERIGFNAQRKNWELDASTVDCRSFVGGREGIIPQSRPGVRKCIAPDSPGERLSAPQAVGTGGIPRLPEKDRRADPCLEHEDCGKAGALLLKGWLRQAAAGLQSRNRLCFKEGEAYDRLRYRARAGCHRIVVRGALDLARTEEPELADSGRDDSRLEPSGQPEHR